MREICTSGSMRGSGGMALLATAARHSLLYWLTSCLGFRRFVCSCGDLIQPWDPPTPRLWRAGKFARKAGVPQLPASNSG